ncbi:RNA polymerase sigma factor [Paraliomyxa miuraensis]|uniref:RNA polymerase sigma factor n=1 Tax=Paraliomyxa miuraensis TaxID=376150 RepID=UPI0022594110|nr:RNA polymerase sigma factor [Paraliomyxa miuraensis]MCX4242696.1 RNA polymerase sigma factor [Paraliomyxa miuraensis]
MTDLHAESSVSSSPAKGPKPGQIHRLMEAYVDGDERAFDQLHAALEPRLRARLSRLVRDVAVVDDLVQLTFLRAHAARDRFASLPERADRAVEGWYLAIARNVALDHLRHNYRRDRRHETLIAKGDVSGMGVPQVEPNAEELQLSLESGDEIARRVRDAIEQLPPGQREVVKLHKLRGMSMADIAQRLGVRPGALRVRAHRAYKALAGLLLPQGEDLATSAAG